MLQLGLLKHLRLAYVVNAKVMEATCILCMDPFCMMFSAVAICVLSGFFAACAQAVTTAIDPKYIS
jgi:hypothetical protein